jgi:predicted Abi (CAAX) family protease
MVFFRSRFQSVWSAFLTFPSTSTWLKCAGVFAVFIVVTAWIGLASGFVYYEPAITNWQSAIALSLILFIAPSLLEEIFFRGLLVPHSREGASHLQAVSQIIVSVAIFVLWHPLNGWLFSPAVWPIFSNPIFLVLAALFGLAATIAYRISGSIWPSVMMHWLTVVSWVLLFGGLKVVQGTLRIY